MVNRSKINDPRSWDRWRRSCAVASGARPVVIELSTRQELLEFFRRKDGPNEPLPGVMAIGGNFYAKTPVARDTLLAALRVIGYNVEDLRTASYRKREGVSVATMERDGWSMWYAKLDIQRGKCGSCGGFISTFGIQFHGHKCELCGAVTYYDITPGSEVRFSFVPKEGQEHSMADIKMKVRWWDVDAGYLYFHPEVKAGLWLREDRAQAYLHANADKWQAVEEDGERLIRVLYRNSCYLEDSVISPADISGHYWNYRIVQVWEGKEYSQYSASLPVRESLSIYEAWHWAPLPVSPTLHKKVLGSIGNDDDKGWHHQDGSPWFNPNMFAEMGKFIRHFTKLDADAWDEASKRFRKDGPGGIDDVTAFCHPRAVAQNKPNIGNLIEGVCKVGRIWRGSHESLTDNELASMADATKDDEAKSDFAKLMTAGTLES